MRAATRTIKPLLAAAAVALCSALALAPSAAAAEPACPNEQVRAESNVNPATGKPYDLGLPECRAYEMVSPLEKQAHDAELEADAQINQNSLAGAAGNAVSFSSLGGFAGLESFNAANAGNPYVARRAAAGWQTFAAGPPAALMPSFGSGVVYSPELSKVATCDRVGADSYLADRAVVCAVREPDGSWVASPAYPNLAGGEVLLTIHNMGFSADLSDAVFQANNLYGPVHLLPGDTTTEQGSGGLYEVAGLGGSSPQLRLVDVNNAGKVIGPESETVLGGRAPGGQTSRYHAVSANGQTIYFTTTPEGSVVSTLFARRYNADGSGETVAISNPSPSQCTRTASEPGGECSAPASGDFRGASANGEKAFFLTTQQLVSADTDSTTDLYEYDFAEPPAHRIVQVSGGGVGDPTPGSGANVQGVVRISNDGSHVYFVATGVLTTIPNAAGQTALAGAENLYGFDTETAQTKFIAQLCSGHEASGSQADPACPSTGSDAALWALKNEERRAQTTPDGRYLIFDTNAQLSPEDTDGAQDVYRYDLQTGELVLVSHAAPGAPTAGNGEMNATICGPNYTLNGAAGDVEGLCRQITENGSTIVFSTAEALQEDDVNAGESPGGCDGGALDHTGCDVYEWHEGVVHMISDGQSPSNAAGFPTISASGVDIFFTTRTQLVAQDTDELGDVYDAHIGGGFPAPKPEPSCSGEACQGAPAPAPAFEAPGSVSFTGGANLTPPPEEASKGTLVTKQASSKPKLTLTLSKVNVSGKALFVTLKSSAKGGLRLSGKGLVTKIVKSLAPGTHTIHVALNRVGIAMRGHGKKTELRVSLIAGKRASVRTKGVRL